MTYRPDPRRTAAQAIAAGTAEQALRDMAAELARLQGFGLDPQEGAAFVNLTLGDSSVLVEYDYTAGDPGCHTQRNGDPGWPATESEVSILGVLINGAFSDPVDCVNADVLERWEQDIRDHIADRAESERAEFYDREAA